MSISGIQSGQNVCNNLFASNAAKPLDQNQFGNILAPDKVQISNDARELAQKAQEERRTQAMTNTGQPEIPEGALPMVAYSIPGWMGEFTPRHAMADQTIGQKYCDSNGALRDSLSPAGKEDLGEYMHTLHETYQSELKDRGIETKLDYYQNIVQDKNLSEQVHQAVRERLAANPRAMELMQEFGINF